MKKLIFLLTALVAISLTSCVIIPDTPGPRGYSGNAYFGISYDRYEPYSYWDNNPDIADNPYFDEYYPTYTGLYDFEYFVNREDYWFGTYEIWVNPGEPGRPGGVAGRNGMDTYLMLVCNPNGPYEDRKAASKLEVTKNTDGSLQYMVRNADGWMKVTMQKASRATRTPHQPKAFFNASK
ncbi:MAG: hypothetical protein V4616_02870 [Bacteroidota bacterium]